MPKIEFTISQYNNLLTSQYKFIEVVATGREVMITEDLYKKEVIFRAYELHPDYISEQSHYVMEVTDPEVAEAAQGSDTDIFYIELT